MRTVRGQPGCASDLASALLVGLPSGVAGEFVPGDGTAGGGGGGVTDAKDDASHDRGEADDGDDERASRSEEAGEDARSRATSS